MLNICPDTKRIIGALRWLACGFALLLALGAPTPASAQGQPGSGDATKDGDADGDGDDGGGDDGGDASGGADATGGDAEGADIDALRKEYLALRDALFRSRARAASVASTLYSTKLRIELFYDSARFYTVTRATIRLDGASVYEDVDGTIGKDKAPRFEGFVAPGRHQVSVRIEAIGNDDERFTSTLESTVSIQAPAGRDVTVKIKAKDDGNIPYNWKKKQKGSYDLRLDIDVDTTERPQAKGASAAAPPRAGRARMTATRTRTTRTRTPAKSAKSAAPARSAASRGARPAK